MIDAGTGPAAPLRLRPFPAMRFDSALVGDVGEVTCPPYDVLDRAMIEDLLVANPRNVVRLVLPRLVHEPLSSDDPYVYAAKRLERWRARGYLRTDPAAALYVYEYGSDEHHVRGLVGALQLTPKSSHSVLPHEEVIGAVVADRLAGIVASRSNLEPILLVYDGDGGTDEEIAAARRGDPLTDVVAADGTFHRIWAITSPEAIRRIRHTIAPHQALIADGHHRYAAYQQLRRRHRAIRDGPGPWDRGLALLIDESTCPLRVGAIHRSIAELSLNALESIPGVDEAIEEVGQHGDDASQPPGAAGQIVLTDGVRRRRLVLPGSATSPITMLLSRPCTVRVRTAASPCCCIRRPPSR